MDWLTGVDRSLRYIEAHLEEDLRVEAVAMAAYVSPSHFQRIFSLVTGITVGEYIRNRRLTRAGLDLVYGGAGVLDTALKYGYESPESFTKAFTRFHGGTPTELKRRRGGLQQFRPITIQVHIQGGFTMSHNRMDAFHWRDGTRPDGATEAEQYQALVSWAAKARGQNPLVFDELTAWLLDDDEWTAEKLYENEQLLLRGVFARFEAQNAALRENLEALRPSGLVNPAVFKALDAFDAALRGELDNAALSQTAGLLFHDFAALLQRPVRERVAGGLTGPEGVNQVPYFGYINVLEECDATVQWALFMPDLAKHQQDGFRVQSFDYLKLPALRFVGREGEELENVENRKAVFAVLDGLAAYASGFDDDLLLMHFNGNNVDTGEWHGLWGRFLRADAPVPEGFAHVDFVPEDDGARGVPFVSSFACAHFTGDTEAMHRREGYDDCAMYDITRNILLGQGVAIPYPHKYWTAEVFPEGCDQPSSAYLFAAMP